MSIKTYSEMCKLKTFDERFLYLKLEGSIGLETFGGSRYMNQAFYKSIEYRDFRNFVIRRDNGCDLGIPGMDIFGTLILHHIEPITKESILEHDEYILLDPNNAICVSLDTHNAIHYGNTEYLNTIKPVVRYPNDTIPWR